AAASAVPEAAASPWHETASGPGHASASAPLPVHNAVGGASRPAHYDPLHAEEWFVRQRAYPLTAIPTGARLRALAQLAALRRAHTGTYGTSGASATTAGAAVPPATAATGTWQHVGPPGQQTNTTST